MKTNILKTGFFAVAMTLCSAGVFAQPSLPGDYTQFSASGTRESIDTVTVGSRMAYRTAGDPTIAPLITAGKMAMSEFQWVFTPTLPIYVPGANGTANAATVSTIAGHTGYYTNGAIGLKEIHTIMPTTSQTIQLLVNEWSMINATTPGCAGTDTTYKIQVVNRPTFAWPADTVMATCLTGAMGNVTIPITLSGYGQWIVGYTITYTPFGGSAGAPVAYTETLATNNSKGGTFNLVIPAARFGTAAQGEYHVRITSLTDRISRKSLDQTLVAARPGAIADVVKDIPKERYLVSLLPTPKTQKLEHVKNLP